MSTKKIIDNSVNVLLKISKTFATTKLDESSAVVKFAYQVYSVLQLEKTSSKIILRILFQSSY